MTTPVLDSSAIATLSGSLASSITVSHTCTGTPILLAAVSAASNALAVTVTGVTYNGVSMTQLSTVTDANYERTYIFYLNTPSTGANNAVATFNPHLETQYEAAIITASFTNAAGTYGTPVTKGNTTNDPINVVVADSTSNDIVFGCIATDAASTTANQTLIQKADNVGSDSSFSAQYKTPGGGSVTMEWDLNASVGGALIGVTVQGVGKTTKNTRAWTLGVNVGMGYGMPI